MWLVLWCASSLTPWSAGSTTMPRIWRDARRRREKTTLFMRLQIQMKRVLWQRKLFLKALCLKCYGDVRLRERARAKGTLSFLSAKYNSWMGNFFFGNRRILTFSPGFLWRVFLRIFSAALTCSYLPTSLCIIISNVMLSSKLFFFTALLPKCL